MRIKSFKGPHKVTHHFPMFNSTHLRDERLFKGPFIELSLASWSLEVFDLGSELVQDFKDLYGVGGLPLAS